MYWTLWWGVWIIMNHPGVTNIALACIFLGSSLGMFPDPKVRKSVPYSNWGLTKRPCSLRAGLEPATSLSRGGHPITTRPPREIHDLLTNPFRSSENYCIRLMPDLGSLIRSSECDRSQGHNWMKTSFMKDANKSDIIHFIFMRFELGVTTSNIHCIWQHLPIIDHRHPVYKAI